MIEFANELAQHEFHLLPAEMQKELNELASSYATLGRSLIVHSVHIWDDERIDLSLRVGKKLDVD
jgi:hypothetical protein